MQILETQFKGLFEVIIEPRFDVRGSFAEFYRKVFFKNYGIDVDFVQDNQSRSKKNVIRGLHFQWDQPLGKLVRVSQGNIFFVAADIRRKSKTFKQWYSCELNDDSARELYVSPGFACGFCVMSKIADVHYKYTAYYNQAGEANIVWNDPTIGIRWPIRDPILSNRDKNAMFLEEWLKKKSSFLT